MFQTMSMLIDSTISFTPTHRSDTLLHGINAGAMPTARISVPTTGNTISRTGPLYGGPFSDDFAIDHLERFNRIGHHSKLGN